MDQIEEVKNKLDIVEVIGKYVALRHGGKNMKGLCPFHGEKSPSFMVNPELQIYKCFGCGKSGDVISFVQEIEGLDFGETLRMLADRVGVKLIFKDSEKKSEKEEMVAIQELAAEYFHYLLTKHSVGQTAREYLKTRKIKEKIIEEFRLGLSLSAWDGLYKYLVLKKKKDPKLVEKTGLIMESSKSRGKYYDRFRARVMFPLLDQRDKVVGFSGRVLPQTKESEMGPKYINSPETDIYHKSEMLYGLSQAKRFIREKSRVVVVEGEIDMISSFAAGVGETVAIKGSALTQQQVDRLSRLTSNLVLSLDADVAGDAAMKRGIQIAEAKGMNIKVVQVHGGKDPDEVARENPSLWMKSVDNAVDVYQFYLDSALTRHDPTSIEGKRRISQEILPVVGKITNKVIQAFYLKKVAGILGVGEESVMKEMERTSLGINDLGNLVRNANFKEEQKGEKNKEEMLMEEILGLVFSVERKIGDKLATKVIELRPETSPHIKILSRWLETDEQIISFIKNLPAELREIAQVSYMKEKEEISAERDLEMAVRDLAELILKKRLEKVALEIEAAENEGNTERVDKLQEEFASLIKRLKA